MTKALDPQGVELDWLLQHAGIGDTRVLEVGSGDGRLTFRYGAACRSVIGIDPQIAAVGRASGGRPAGRRLRFLSASARGLPFRDGSFDVVLFAWSL